MVQMYLTRTKKHKVYDLYTEKAAIHSHFHNKIMDSFYRDIYGGLANKFNFKQIGSVPYNGC